MSFLIITLVFVILFGLYDSLRHNYEKNKTETLSILWHSVGWITMFLFSIYSYYNIFGTTFIGWRWVVLLISISWITRDLMWNIMGKMPLLYVGDGKGGIIEKFIFWLSFKIKINPEITLLIIKVILLLMSISMFIIF